MKCRDTRWQLDPFLKGGLSDDLREGIADHLDNCPDCVEYLADCGKLSLMPPPQQRQLSPDFSQRVLNTITILDDSRRLLHYFLSSLAAAVAFAIAVFAFVRYYWQPEPLATHGTEQVGSSFVTELLPVLEQSFSNPTVQYLLLSVAAIVVTIALVLLVDTPKQLLKKSS